MTNAYTILAGTLPVKPQPMPPFSPIVLDFLQALSRQLLHHPQAAHDPAWAALGFWLRPSHLRQLADAVSQKDRRLGRGLIFHIAPANMPAVFAYSLCLSLLGGNSNIVRLPSRLVPSVAPVCHIIDSIWQDESFAALRNQNAILTYPHDDSLTKRFSLQCDGRVIWGGDASIAAIRAFPLPPQAVELTFADRYSLAVFSSQAICDCSEDDLRHWAHLFYNDTYGVDQNACSSPRLICWLDADESRTSMAQQRWWKAVQAEAASYDLHPFKVSTKYTDAWKFSMTYAQHIQSVSWLTNRVYVYTLSSLPEDITALSGKFGQFFQYSLRSIHQLMPFLCKKVQTITTLGIPPEELRKTVISAGSMGVDRIVLIGQALDMNVVWDGCNMIELLSRCIN